MGWNVCPLTVAFRMIFLCLPQVEANQSDVSPFLFSDAALCFSLPRQFDECVFFFGTRCPHLEVSCWPTCGVVGCANQVAVKSMAIFLLASLSLSNSSWFLIVSGMFQEKRNPKKFMILRRTSLETRIEGRQECGYCSNSICPRGSLMFCFALFCELMV